MPRIPHCQSYWQWNRPRADIHASLPIPLAVESPEGVDECPEGVGRSLTTGPRASQEVSLPILLALEPPEGV